MRVSKPPEERKAELVAAARRLFDKNGIQKTRVSDIVKDVGVAQGVFYYYFASKDAMVQEVIRQVSAEVEDKASAILAGTDAPFCEKLSQFIELYLDLIDQFLGDEETSLGGLDVDAIEQGSPLSYGSTIVTQKLLELVEQGAAAGEVAAAYPEESALVLFGGLRALAANRLPGRRMIYTITEQGLCLPKGSLVRYCDTRTGVPEV